MSKRKKQKQKFRTDFRKNRTSRQRKTDLTRHFQGDATNEDDLVQRESVRGKGALTRRRTVVGDIAEDGDTGLAVHPEVDLSVCRYGTILAVHGLESIVETEDGKQFRCATRRLLKTLATEQRHVVVVGDQVWFRPQDGGGGMIERIARRHGVLSRTSRGRQHVIVANIDQVLIVTSAAEPVLKPHLVDRLILSAEKGGVRPVICINKIDLIDPADLQPLVGVYGQMGYEVILMSAVTGRNIELVQACLADCQTVLTGQSGVGKSSLMNALSPDLNLRVRTVNDNTQKGRHATTSARLIRLSGGGYVVDTPGIRQFELWDVRPNEVANYFRDLRSYIDLCRFPNCTHSHEADCAVKDAVADGRLDARRYESYCQLLSGD